VPTETARKEQLTIRLRHMSGGLNNCRHQSRPQFAKAEGKSITERWQIKEDQLWAMWYQLEDLTSQISNLCGHNGNGSRNRFAERQTQGR
jgi:hypothetical protein